MAGGPLKSLTQPSSQKKQQSISSFFSRQSSTPKPASTATKPSNRIDVENHKASGDISEGESPVGGRRGVRISKRVLDDDEDGADEVLPASKRRRSTSIAGDDELQEASPNRDSLFVQAQPDALNRTRLPKLSGRTSKYLFSSSAAGTESEDEDSEQTRRHKERMHQRFVQKLGRPDSMAEIRRRNHIISEETAEGEGDENEEPDEEEALPEKPARGKKGPAAKKAGSKLTPMEKQIIEIKRKHMDTVLLIEVGYKFRFFGEDARVAAKELSIVCIPGKYRYDEDPSEAHLDRFASASIPVHRLHVHVKRLVAAGYKIGVVRQIETAALKAAGDNRNTPFIRKLTNVYTKGTYIDEDEGLDASIAGPAGGAPATGYLLCLTETNARGWGTDEKVHLGIVAVQPATGDVIYDDFEDGFMRSELETRILHIAPCEFLIVGELSKATERLVQHLSGSKSNVFGDKVRVERVEKKKTMAAEAHAHISRFYAEKSVSSTQTDKTGASLLDKVHGLSEHVTVSLSAMITHLTEYGLEHVFDLTKYFQSFSARSHMLLNGNTLTSLEIYQNQTDHTENGSLFWLLDRTKTRFGRRLLRSWVGRPLLDRARLTERTDALEELNSTEKVAQVQKLKQTLGIVRGDLEKSLNRIYYKKCSRKELLHTLQMMQRIASQYVQVQDITQAGFSSQLISQAILNLPTILDDAIGFLQRINADAAEHDDKYNFFVEAHETEDITDHRVGIASVEHSLDEHRKDAAQALGKKRVDYVTVAGIEYLIEVENTGIKKVPATWMKISGTKKVSRFHTPEVVRFIRERDQHKESLAAACEKAFVDLLSEISNKYQEFRDCIQSLATLDCLLSLAEIATQPGYTKPTYTDTTEISVSQGRHPMIEQLLLDAYVPNDINLSAAPGDTRALLITGPNMGGKSSYVRQTALITIMGQIGSYVPAASARLGMFDAVFTRMGAFDNMMAGESTFMVELSETRDILKQAGPRSLVILDELGRGTSTHDGVAIAQAVLEWVVGEVGCLTLFITHYQGLSRLAEGYPGGELRNVHMRFDETGAGGEEITFLYEVGEGVAHRSYGLNVARLANIPEPVLDLATIKSKELEVAMASKKLTNLARLVSEVMSGKETDDDSIDKLIAGIEYL